MASNNLHFKTAINVPKSTEPTELPIELMAGVGGVLVLFLITVAVVWIRMNRRSNLPEA